MKLKSLLTRLGLATVLIASLGACTVVPAYPTGYYRAPAPAYVESYPAYGYSGSVYVAPPPRVYEHHDRYYGGGYRREIPLPPPLQLHRDIRRSLGLPRLPGMP